MSSELSEQKPQQPARLQNMANRPSEPEHLPCPRCESTNTKFCYYNNYNLSQPRHFCKSCRRYWTRGGTLRNVPVGGVSRKSNKRSRTTSPTVSSTAAAGPSTSSSSSTVTTNDLLPAEPVKHENGFGSGSPFCGMVNLNEAAAEDFGSFFKGQQQGGGSFMPLGYFGFGSGLGLGSGFGTWDWPSEQVVDGGDNGGVMSGAASTWQLGCGGEGGLADGDCYGWSDLAISAPVQSLK